MAITAVMLLADSAQAVEGKLYVLGGGWDRAAPGTPSAIAILMKVSWDLTNRTHHFKVELVDHDGDSVMVPGPVGEQALVVEGDFEVGRPPGMPQGMDLPVPLAFNIGPLPIDVGQRYTWRLWINGETDDLWRLPFYVAAPRQGAVSPPQSEPQ